ncbi:non-ribosomal peptide synthetase [Vibrio nitrifigilis]|uniref:Amino acid adenylation domain-containing protein n=1 Tax=Vibrio nitrifigilis TaxID=2789781 RepID=A0ABS0GDC3_9VIBR|nr:non-ribosomal peptide synthetase [Vibrio nitrifigilis]MBF9000419.1 amino acid adenylation domain-containing protein [Vibrio nitrifigilis]
MIDLNRSSNNFGEQQSVALPLTAAQQGIWFAQQLNNEADAKVFKVIEYIEINGPIEAPLLVKAIQHVHSETDALQMNFTVATGGDVWQTYHPRSCLVDVVDVSDKPSPQNAAQAWLDHESHRTFDVHNGPLCAFAVIKLANDRYWYFSCAHHLVMDGFGARLFCSRVADVYTALAQQQAVPDCPFTPLHDVIELETQYQDSRQFSKDETYWCEQMDHRPAALSLSNRHETCVEIVRRQSYLPRRLHQKLIALAHTLHSPLPQLLITLNALYLARITHQQDVVIGCPMTGRRQKAARLCPSMMSNVLPLRLTISPECCLAELVDQVNAKVMSMVRHQAYRGETLATKLGLVSQTESLCLTHINILPFDYTMTFAGHSVQAHNLALGPIEDLAINICDRGEQSGLELCLDANRSLYSDEELEARFTRIMSFYEQSVEQELTTNIGVFPILSEQDKTHWSKSNATELNFGAFQPVYQLIEQQAQHHPDLIALKTKHDVVTYSQLNRRANQLAHFLRNEGVCAEQKVAVCCDRSIEWVTALLAILKAGGAYIPIDPAYPNERIEYMLENSQPNVLITDGIVDFSVMPYQQSNEVPLINVVRDSAQWSQQSEQNLDLSDTSSHDLAYIIYTSGSTGKPKGVQVEHHTLTNLIHWHNHTFNVKQGTGASSVAGMGFDAAVWEVWPPLSAGGCLHMPSVSVSSDPQQLLDWWIDQPIEVGFLPTPIAELAMARDIAPSTLRYLLVGGDKLTRHPADDKHYQLVNNYGPTETTVVATSGVMKSSGTLDIGGPIANTRIYILDDRLQPVPLGVTGEIYIGGAGVARGYLNLPEQTEQRFIADPFTHCLDAKMYRTGDLGCWRDDGTITYQGRNDSQVKIRGFRIELGEIANALQQCEGVVSAVVIAQGQHEDNKRLIAYYTSEQLALDNQGLQQHLSQLLPGYMVPAAYVYLADIPLTANGKVDYRQLPEPDTSAFIQRKFEAPETELECLLANIWQDLLGVASVGRHDNFFELGGHSLLAVRLIDQLRQHGYSLAIKSLFTYPTLEQLAKSLAASDHQTLFNQVPENKIPKGCRTITPALLSLIELTQEQINMVVEAMPGGAENIQDIYPLAPLQEGILFHHMLAEKGDPYITRAIKAFPDRSALDAFVHALQAVIERHDILRTAILWDKLEQPVQVVCRHVELDVDTLYFDEQDKVAALKERFDPDITRINVQSAPMMELHATQDPDNERWLLCLMMHHLCFDHTTLELMMEEVQAHILGCEAQLPAPLPFRNFVYESRKNIDIAAQTAYFSERFADIDEPCAPFGLLEVQGNGSDISELRVPLNDTLAKEVRKVAKQTGVSTASLFHLAWAMVLRAATGTDDITFGTVLFGRMAAGDGANRVLGMFLNTLPLRLQLEALTVTQAVYETHQRLAELLDYEHASLSLAQQCSGLSQQTPLFSALINYRYDGGSSQLEFESAPVDLVYAEERTNYPMVMSVNDNPGKGFSLDLQVAAHVGCERVSDMVIMALRGIVESLSSAPHLQLNQVNVLSQQQVHTLVNELNQTQLTLNPSDTLVSLFIQHALAYPNDVAIITETKQITYGELERQTNQLSRYLRAQGVDKDQRVAVCFDRSVDSVLAMLAVLKSGAAYIPMDPHYPAERLQYMVENSQPSLVLTDGVIDLGAVLVQQDVEIVNTLRDTQWQNESNAGLPHHVEPDDLAYIIYTSGSTGKPKGVMVEHGNLNHLIQWHNHRFALQRGTHASAVAGVGFDASVWEMWPPLAVGGTLHLPSIAVSRDPEQLIAWWQQAPLEVGFLSTPIAELVLKRRLTHPSLRYLLVGGDRLNIAPPEQCTYQLINNYGPTETTVVATSGEITATNKTLDIGQPISNTAIYILDAHGQLLPRGVAGEIYIGGKGVARGYLDLPEMTSQRFLPDRFSTTSNARMYRTGDLGRWLDNGTIEYLGRNDSQVKIRGFRIELGEISATLGTHGGVEEAVVTVTQTDNKQLIAHYVGQAQASALKAYLTARLPEYMVPVAYVKLPALPLTPNGKLDYRSLPHPQQSDFVTQRYEAPEGEVEIHLAQIWQRLLGVNQVGRQDSFFELGGHSMLAVQFLNEARQLGYELSLSSLFTSSKLVDIADSIQRQGQQADTAVALRPIEGDQRALFIVPEASGEMMYAPLFAAYIDSDIPVYGLQAPDRTEAPFKTVEAAAARFARIMCRTQPKGPYRMTGISLGGTLAWEIAKQLLGQDKEVEYVGIVDTTAIKPQVARHQQRDSMTDDQQLRAMSKEVFDGLAADILSLNEDNTPEDNDKTWFDYYLMAAEMGILPSGWSEHYYRQWLLHREGILAADYQYRSLPLEMDLLIAELRPEHETAEDARFLCWDRFMEPENIRTALIKETNHYHVFVEPYIGYMGEAISQGIHQREDEVIKQRPLTQDKGYQAITVLQSSSSATKICVYLLDPCALVTGTDNIVQQFDASWNVIGINPRGIYDTSVPHTTVDAAASCYWHALQANLSVDLPVTIIGEHQNGWIAEQLAQLMVQEQRNVETVCLLNPPQQSTCDVTNLEAMAWFVAQMSILGRVSGVTESDLQQIDHHERVAMLHQMYESQLTLDQFERLLYVVATQLRMPNIGSANSLEVNDIAISKLTGVTSKLINQLVKN